MARHRRWPFVAAAVAVVASIGAVGVAHVASVRVASGTPSGRAVLDRLPLAFEANVGQFDPSVKFVARTPGQQVALTADGFSLSPAGVSVSLRGARVGAAVVGEQRLSGDVSRFVGSDASTWRTGLATYGQVVYQGVYPGVDVVFHGQGRQVEHDFVVAPGADPGVISLDVSGAGSAHLDYGGDLVAGDVRVQAPRLYQDAEGRRRPVSGHFVARPDGTFGFAVGAYDRTRPLVIDPVVLTSSYLGGSSTDTAYGVAVDADGSMVVTGYTESSDFPSVNPAQAPISQPEGSRTDVFVTKVKSDGTSVVWSTYLGGHGRDAAFADAIGSDGSVYVTGYTESADFPTVKPLQAFNAGGASDVFVTKINATGTALTYSTYLGGSGADSGSGLSVDASGAVYVDGATGSSNFPLARAFQDHLSTANDVDGFVSKIDPSGSTLVYSSYLGGPGDDHAIDIAVDGQGNAYVTGDTKSTTFPTVRPVQPALGAGGAGGTFSDAFVAKVRADGSGLDYSTYLGGGDSDKGTGIAVDSQGDAYVTGNTGSSNFPSVSAAQPKKSGDFDAFVTKLRPDGSTLAYSTFLGGTGSDGAESIAVDEQGHAFVTGATASSDFPTVRPFQSAKGGGFVDAFVTEVAASGTSFVSSSYLGGRDDDQAAAIVLDKAGDAVVVGYTNSTDFPTAKPFQPGKAGGVGDAFVTKIRKDAAGGEAAPGTPTPATSKHDRRVRTLITITGGLFLAALLQTLWLRRRPEQKPRPQPRPAGAGAGAGGGAGGRGGPAGAPALRRRPPPGPPRRSGDRPAPDEREPTIPPPGRTPERVPASVGAEDRAGGGMWGADRPWRRQSPGPDWDLSDRPLLRPLERAPAPATPPRMPAPDLWEGEAEDGPVAAATRPAPAPTAAGAPSPPPPSPATASSGPPAPPLSGRDQWETVPATVDPAATGGLDPLDVWGPLFQPQDPDEWARDWGVADAVAAMPAVTSPPAPALASPPPALASRPPDVALPPPPQPEVAPPPPPQPEAAAPAPLAPGPPHAAAPVLPAPAPTAPEPLEESPPPVAVEPPPARRSIADDQGALEQLAEAVLAGGPIRSRATAPAEPPSVRPPSVRPPSVQPPSEEPPEPPPAGPAPTDFAPAPEPPAPEPPAPEPPAPEPPLSPEAPAAEVRTVEQPELLAERPSAPVVEEPRPPEPLEPAEPAAAVPVVDEPPSPEPEPEPVAPVLEEHEPAPRRDLSIADLLSEDLPIPDPSVAPPPPEPEPEQVWLNNILDEEFSAPDTDAVADAVADAVPDAGVVAVTVPPPPEPALDDDVLPPPPPHLLVNLFEPDPDDPLVQALQAREEGEEREEVDDPQS